MVRARRTCLGCHLVNFNFNACKMFFRARRRSMVKLDPALLKLFPPSSGTCPPGAAFVSLVANVSYVPGALCLRSRMTSVGTACPLVLVVADPLPRHAMVELEEAYGPGRIRRLSDLQERLRRHSAARQNHSAAASDAAPNPLGRRLAKGFAREPATKPLSSSRQLVRSTGWARRTHQKLLLWALDGYTTAAFIDIDTLVRSNIDALLSRSHRPFSAVSALPYSLGMFNSGVFVYEPSLEVAAALDDVSRRAVFRLPKRSSEAEPAGGWLKVRPAGERFELSDQSVLNHYFRRTWRPLPYGYNAGVKMLSAAPKMWASLEVAVVHYVHRPKPWEAELSDSGSPISTLARRMRTHEVMHEWRRLCPRGSRNRA